MLNAVVIPFPRTPAPGLQANADVNGPAQIIIFPGVRRERHGDGAKPARRRGKPKRDRLELPE